MESIFALSFLVLSSSSFAKDLSSEYQFAVREAVSYYSTPVKASLGSDMNSEYQAAVLEATANLKLFQGCGGCVTMQDEYNSAVEEAVKFW